MATSRVAHARFGVLLFVCFVAAAPSSAYSSGPHAFTVDLSLKTRLTWAGWAFRSGLFWRSFGDIAVQDDIGCATTAYGLVVFDLSDPTQPEAVAHFHLADAYESVVSIEGTRAYVGDYRLWWAMIDISVPRAPVLMSRQMTPAAVTSVVGAGDNVYVAASLEGLRVYDASNPGAPWVVDSSGIDGLAWEIAAQPGYLYVTGQGLNILDISVPSAPVLVGVVDSLSWPQPLAVQGDWAYVGEAWANRLRVVNVSDPAKPVRHGLLELMGAPLDIAIADTFGVVIAAGQNPWELDLRFPENPLWRGTFAAGSARRVAIRDSLAFVSGYTDVLVFDMMPVGPPAQIGEYRPPAPFDAVAAERDYVYLTSDEDRIVIVDAGDILAPRVIGSITGRFGALWTQDSLLLAQRDTLIGTYHPRIEVYNVADPAAPVQLAYFDASQRALRLQGQDSLIFVQTYNGIEIWNLADPASPRFVSTTDSAGEYEPTPHDTILFTARKADVVVYNISNPAFPTQIALLDSVGGTADLASSGHLLLQLRDAYPLEFVVYDVTDPAQPVPRGSIEIEGEPRDLVVVDGYAVVAAAPSGIIAIDVTDPDLPEVAAIFEAGQLNALTAIGRHVISAGSLGALITELLAEDQIIPGDVNADLSVNSADIIYLVNYTFKGGPEPLPTAGHGDVDCTGSVSSADIVFLVNYVFKGGPNPGCP